MDEVNHNNNHSYEPSTSNPSSPPAKPGKVFSIWGTLALILGIASLCTGPGALYVVAEVDLDVIPKIFNSLLDYFYYFGYALGISGFACAIISIKKKEHLLGLAVAGIVCSCFGLLEALGCHMFCLAINAFLEGLSGLSYK